MKLLCSDYDGTIRFNDGIKDNDVEAINRFIEQGNAFCVVSGRSLRSLLLELPQYNISCPYLVGNNGGIIIDKDENIIKRHLLDFDEALEIIEKLKDENVINFYVDDGIDSGYYYEEEYDQPFSSFKKTSYTNIIKNNIVCAIKVKHNNHQEAVEFANKINPTLKSAIAITNKNYNDIVAKGIGKEIAVGELRDILNIDQVYTIGDELNDLLMIKEFNGSTIVSGNEKVKEVSNMIFDDISGYIDYISKK
ncbi:MAG: HAD-IIB family hydrolase [Erysipelotrichaceae bacterium]